MDFRRQQRQFRLRLQRIRIPSIVSSRSVRVFQLPSTSGRPCRRPWLATVLLASLWRHRFQSCLHPRNPKLQPLWSSCVCDWISINEVARTRLGAAAGLVCVSARARFLTRPKLVGQLLEVERSDIARFPAGFLVCRFRRSVCVPRNLPFRLVL